MKKTTFLRLEILTFLMMWASNFAHPVTPAFFTGLNFPDSMFGISFAAMSITFFFFSPLWGKMADRRGSIPMMALSLATYGICQWFFGMITNPVQLVIVRLFCGGFTCGYQVIAMAMVGNLGNEKTRPRLLSIHGAISVAAGAAGYLTGGYIGLISVVWAFRIQAITLILLGVAVLLLLDEIKVEKQPVLETEKKPAASWSLPLILMLSAVMMASFGTTGYENAFNYYITDELAFPTSYNGLIKAITGLIGFGANMLLQQYLAKGRDSRSTLTIVLAVNVVLLLLAQMVPGAAPFIAANVVFTAFNAMILPLQQAAAARGQSGSMGRIAGLFSAARSLGMVFGSLFAGFIYSVDSRLPFYCAAAAFAIACVIVVLQKKKAA